VPLRFSIPDFIRGAIQTYQGMLQGQIEGEAIYRQRQTEAFDRALQTWRLAHGLEAEDEARILGMAKLLSQSGQVDLANSLLARPHAFDLSALAGAVPPGPEWSGVRSILGTPPRALPAPPTIITKAAPTPKPAGSTGGAAPVMGPSIRLAGPPTLTPAPLPSGFHPPTALLPPIAHYPMGAPTTPPAPPAPAPAPAPKRQLVVPGLGSFDADLVPEEARKAAVTTWRELVGKSTNATLATVQQQDAYRRALALWPGSINTSQELDQAGEAIRLMSLALVGTGPAPTAHGDKQRMAAQRYFEGLVGRLPAWARLAPSAQAPLLQEFAEAARAAGHPLQLPAEIRQQLSPAEAKRLDIQFRRLKLEGDRLQLARDRQADAKQAREAKRLIGEATTKFSAAENALFRSHVSVLTRKRKDGSPYYSHEERANAKAGLRILGKKAGMDLRGIGLQNYAVSVTERPGKSGGLSNTQRLELIRELMKRGKTRKEAEAIAGRYR
jgi:hypothetical protein